MIVFDFREKVYLFRFCWKGILFLKKAQDVLWFGVIEKVSFVACLEVFGVSLSEIVSA